MASPLLSPLFLRPLANNSLTPPPNLKSEFCHRVLESKLGLVALVSPIPTDPPVPPFPPDPPPVSLFLVISDSEDPILDSVLNPSPTYHRSQSLHLHKSKASFCLAWTCPLSKSPKPLPHSISQVWFLRSLSATYTVWESHVFTCVPVNFTHLIFERLITAKCRAWFLFSSTIPPSGLPLKSELVWRLNLIPDISCDVNTLSKYESITQLPQFEDFLELSCSTVIELPCLEDFANSLASFWFLCFLPFGNCRLIHPQPNQQVTRVYVKTARLVSSLECGLGWIVKDLHQTVLSKDTAIRRYVSSASIAECLAVKSALLAAHSMELQHLNVFSDSPSLVSLLRLKSVINELKSILTDIYCLCNDLYFVSFLYVSCLDNIKAYAMAKSALCNTNSSSLCGV